MITKEEIKKEVDNLPESLLEEVYRLLKNMARPQSPKKAKLTVRDFKGKLDHTDIRSAAYE